MIKKVSVKEIIATKIIFAILAMGYYWMLSREDWNSYYPVIQCLAGGTLVFILFIHSIRISKYTKEGIDELAEINIRRCDAICFKLLIVVMLIIAYAGGILGHVNVISPSIMGWAIVISILITSILRTILFFIMDTKGI